MYCSHCGREIPDDAQYCKYCGTQVKREPENTTPVAGGHPADHSTGQQETSWRRNPDRQTDARNKTAQDPAWMKEQDRPTAAQRAGDPGQNGSSKTGKRWLFPVLCVVCVVLAAGIAWQLLDIIRVDRATVSYGAEEENEEVTDSSRSVSEEDTDTVSLS